MPTAEREFHFRLHARRANHPAAGSLTGQVVKQRRLACAWAQYPAISLSVRARP